MDARQDELVRALRALDKEPEERPAPRDRPAAPVTKSNIFRHHDAHPLALATCMYEAFSTDWLSWEAETLWQEIRRHYRTDKLGDHNRTKIQAIRTSQISDWPWTKWEIFCPIVQALNNNIPDFAVLRKPEPGQLMVAVDILNKLRDDVEWSDEVQGFAGAALLERGITYAPPPITFCQDEISRYLKEHKIPAKPQAVKDRFVAVAHQSAEEVELVESPVDVQVAKLIIARDYLMMRRSQLKAQLETLR